MIGGQAVASHAALREFAEGCRQFDRGVQRVAAGHDAIGEPHLACLVAAHTTTGENQVQRVAVTEHPGKADGAAIDERHAPPSTIDAKYRIFCRHAQVTPKRELKAARDGKTFHRRDNGFAEQHTRRPHRAVTVSQHAVAATVCDCLEICPGAECALGASQDRNI